MYFKKKIAILGSTGSIGKSSLKIISKYKKKFSIELLVCNKDFKSIVKQSKKFLPKYIYIHNEFCRSNFEKIKFKKKIIIINNYNILKKTFSKNYFDKVIMGISSFDGLQYSFDFLKCSREILLANKESLVCGGKVFLNAAKKQDCKIVSIDSELYCLYEILKNNNPKFIDNVYLTASGGPFLNKKLLKNKKISIQSVTNHPNWNMGKKISVDSATMVNKIFEIIEAHLLLDLSIKKIKIKIHKESLIHAAVVFNNGIVRMIMHDTDMAIPIRNNLLDKEFFNLKNNYFKDCKNFVLTFNETNLKKYKILKTGYNVINMGHGAWILFNVINDILVKMFLNKEIFFYEIVQNLVKVFNNKLTISYCKKTVKNYSDIKVLINYGKYLVKKIPLH